MAAMCVSLTKHDTKHTTNENEAGNIKNYASKDPEILSIRNTFLSLTAEIIIISQPF